MKKLLTTGIMVIATFTAKAQLTQPVTVQQNSTSENTIVGGTINEQDQDAKLEINIRNGNNYSSMKGLEIAVSHPDLVPPGTPITFPALNIEMYQSLPFPPYTLSNSNLFTVDYNGVTSIKPSNYNFSGLLNVGGSIQAITSFERSFEINPKNLTLAWKRSTQTTGSMAAQNFTIGYLGDATYPTVDVMTFTPDGKVGVGTTSMPGTYLLYVGGKAIAEEFTVKLESQWPDYVFDNSYKVMSFEELKAYINQNGKLPYLPSAEDVAENGIDVGFTQVQLTRLMEEMTLRMIDMDEKIKELEAKLDDYSQQ